MSPGREGATREKREEERRGEETSLVFSRLEEAREGAQIEASGDDGYRWMAERRGRGTRVEMGMVAED